MNHLGNTENQQDRCERQVIAKKVGYPVFAQDHSERVAGDNAQDRARQHDDGERSEYLPYPGRGLRHDNIVEYDDRQDGTKRVDQDALPAQYARYRTRRPDRTKQRHDYGRTADGNNTAEQGRQVDIPSKNQVRCQRRNEPRDGDADRYKIAHNRTVTANLGQF